MRELKKSEASSGIWILIAVGIFFYMDITHRHEIDAISKRIITRSRDTITVDNETYIVRYKVESSYYDPKPVEPLETP